MDRNNVGHILARICERAGVPVYSPHDFRHTFTTAMRRAGVHAKVLSKVLGHGKSTGNLALDVYDHTDDNDIRKALAMGANWLMQEDAIQSALLANCQMFPQMCPDGPVQQGASSSS